MAASASAKRSRSGCITCKIRRVKCDERRPNCQRCIDSGRTCDGYASTTTSHQSRRALATAVRQLQVAGPACRILGNALPVDDVASFDFFRFATASMTSAILPGEFWSHLLLKTAHFEPAVWQAVVSIGALHRRWEHTNVRAARPATGAETVDIGRFTDQGVKHYLTAISLAKNIGNPTSLAVISVALAAAAHLAGRWQECQVHVRAGLHLLRRMEAGELINEVCARASPSDLHALSNTLERLDLQGMAFSDVRAPYDYSSGLSTAKRASLLAHPSRGSHDVLTAEELDQAALAVFRTIRRFWIEGIAGGIGLMTPTDWQVAHAEIVSDSANLHLLLADLEHATQREVRAHSPGHSPERQLQQHQLRQKLLTLRLYHTLNALVLAIGFFGPEMRWDSQLSAFERVVDLAAELARNTNSPLPFFMSLEPGIGMPLYLTVVRCRHPIVRRRALGLLRSLNRQEGIWNCTAAARVAEHVVVVEEEGLGLRLPMEIQVEDLGGVVWPGGLNVVRDETHWPLEQGGWPKVPEEKRLLQLQVRVDVEENRIEQQIFVVGSHGQGVLARTVAFDI